MPFTQRALSGFLNVFIMKPIRKKNRKLTGNYLAAWGVSRWTVHCSSEKKGSVSVAVRPSTSPVVVSTESDLKHRGAMGIFSSRSCHSAVSAFDR